MEMYEQFPSTPPSSYILRGVGLSSYQPICLSIYLPVYLQTWQPCYSTRLLHFQVDNIKNAALLRDFLIFCSWQHQKRSNSARPPHFLKLTTSKKKQFCETSSFFKVDNIKNKAIPRDFLQKWKVECRANSFVRVPMSFAIFPVHLSKLFYTTAPTTKKWC